jgi:hypothetical protein
VRFRTRGPWKEGASIRGDDTSCAVSRLGGECLMIRIAVTPAAFEAIAATLPLASVGFENKVNEQASG